MRIQISDATIRTAQVEIKALTVSGKQVTLAVFRQLADESLLSADGELLGLPWGTVNYHPDEECRRTSEKHVHVVWQKGSELLRAAVREPPSKATLSSEIADAWISKEVLNGWCPEVRWAPLVRVAVSGDEAVSVVIPEDARKVMRWGANMSTAQQLRDRVNGIGLDAPALDAAFELELLAAVRAFKTNRESWRQLQELPQLFIAV